MLHVIGNKAEIYHAKIGFVDSKWSNLNTPGSYNPLGLSQGAKGIVLLLISSDSVLVQRFRLSIGVSSVDHIQLDEDACAQVELYRFRNCWIHKS